MTIRNIPAWVRENVDLKDAFAFGGCALITVGAAQIYPPAGWIVPGVFLMALGLWERG